MVEQNLHERKIDEFCDQIFGTCPIPFNTTESPEDKCLAKLIKRYKITIPLIKIRDQYYLFGVQKFKMEYKYSHIIIKIGSGIERFDSFAPTNQRKIQRQIVDYMAKA